MFEITIMSATQGGYMPKSWLPFSGIALVHIEPFKLKTILAASSLYTGHSGAE